ncbi:MAG TPA: hypothetical protein VMZ31_16735 [Phycisphaerae bacterium]|nr:hypothetical protein [Phycisphaerae bacterium]
MYYDFSAAFLRVQPPDSNFGEAWESLCYAMLRAELDESSLMRLAPPDKGVDILSRGMSAAYQCKSDERGTAGSISAKDSLDSLRTAMANRASLGWATYAFCTNAHYTGTAVTKINAEAARLNLTRDQLDFKGPEYWDELCKKHSSLVDHRFDFRVTATEKQVIEAFKKARYYDRYVQEFAAKIRQADFLFAIRNNRTPVVIEIPFSPELTVKNCVDAVKELLGVSLDWTNFTDMQTSAGPSISLTIDRVAQGFNKKIADLQVESGRPLEFWIKIVWRDETQQDAPSEGQLYRGLMLQKRLDRVHTWSRNELDYGQRRQITLDRAEALVQSMIWTAARRLRE